MPVEKQFLDNLFQKLFPVTMLHHVFVVFIMFVMFVLIGGCK